MEREQDIIIRPRRHTDEEQQEVFDRADQILKILEQSIKEDIWDTFPQGDSTGPVSRRTGLNTRTVQLSKTGAKERDNKEVYRVSPLFENDIDGDVKKHSFTVEQETKLRIKNLLEEIGLSYADACFIINNKYGTDEGEGWVPAQKLKDLRRKYEDDIKKLNKKIEIINELTNTIGNSDKIVQGYMHNRIGELAETVLWREKIWGRISVVTNIFEMYTSEFRTFKKDLENAISIFGSSLKQNNKTNYGNSINTIIELIKQNCGNDSINPLIASSIVAKHALYANIERIGGEGTALALSNELYKEGLKDFKYDIEEGFHLFEKYSLDSTQITSSVDLYDDFYRICGSIFRHYFFAPFFVAYSEDPNNFMKMVKNVLNDLSNNGRIQKSSMHLFWKTWQKEFKSEGSILEIMNYSVRPPRFTFYE